MDISVNLAHDLFQYGDLELLQTTWTETFFVFDVLAYIYEKIDLGLHYHIHISLGLPSLNNCKHVDGFYDFFVHIMTIKVTFIVFFPPRVASEKCPCMLVR